MFQMLEDLASLDVISVTAILSAGDYPIIYTCVLRLCYVFEGSPVIANSCFFMMSNVAQRY